MFPIAKDLSLFDNNILSPDISRLVKDASLLIIVTAEMVSDWINPKDASLPIIVTAEMVSVSINPKEASPPQRVPKLNN